MSIESHIHEDAAGGVRLAESPGFSTGLIPYILSTADALVILLSSIAGGIGYQVWAGYPTPDPLPLCTIGLFASFTHILRMSGSGYYDFPDSAKPRVEITEILVCWFTTGLLLAFFAFLLKVSVDYSRGGLVMFYLLAAVGLLGVRKATKGALATALSRGAVGRSDIVLLADPSELAALQQQDFLAFFGCTALNRFALSKDEDLARRVQSDLRTVESVAAFVRQNDCREIVLALPWADTERIELIRDQAKRLPVAVRLMPDAQVRSLTSYTSSVRQRVLSIEIQRAPLGMAECLAKRTIDIVGAIVALVLFLPIMCLTAVAIKLDSSGPVIFRQSRKGFNGKQFAMYKFRTMTVQENGPVIVQARRNDPRVTAIGRLLRSASIDELPQLINVLKGDMSLIGPRPHALAHDNEFEKLLSDYAFRHHVKPGITGWAQCNGSRGATPGVEQIAERVKFDLWYINNWSLWLDLQIIAKTFFEVLRKRNAF
jgi:Undecaprenyl-phosphate glucose phosphotransferase